MPTKRLKNHRHVYERISSDGRLTGYQVKIRQKGFPDYAKTFDRLADADAAVVQVLNDRNHGSRRDHRAPERITLGEVLENAIREVQQSDKKGKDGEAARLSTFIKRYPPFCQMSMANITRQDWVEWKALRLEEVKSSTVRREMNLLMPVMRQAAIDLKMLGSPLDQVSRPQVRDERIIRLEPDEEDRLFHEFACARNKLLLPAARFALETGCRRSELLRLRWSDYSHNGGTIYLHDAKNGRGRDILLTYAAQVVVEELPGREKREGHIFPISAEALKNAFERARLRAGVAHWRWHDFRHEAISRCFDHGWTAEQVMDFSGHVDIKSLLRYRHPRVSDAVARLRKMESERQAAGSLRIAV
ncbi:tyrosine-type recombinase/integrase [Stappia indica]|uniref:tyrosine-type recombinase/integrase n=1 Tax=Stappia indica TaxID=538381 RepID=UPI001CD28776|nr:site-specific integrase [Stappia indica]MCA1300581.1 site-specific integrase [Stappia indica]